MAHTRVHSRGRGHDHSRIRACKAPSELERLKVEEPGAARKSLLKASFLRLSLEIPEVGCMHMGTGVQGEVGPAVQAREAGNSIRQVSRERDKPSWRKSSPVAVPAQQHIGNEK